MNCRLSLLAAIVVLFQGCAAPQKQLSWQNRIPFPEEEYAALKTSGTGTVTGQAFLRTRGGDVKLAAGNTVLLNPVTSYSKQFAAYQFGSPDARSDADLLVGEADYRAVEATISQKADAEGRFKFTNVAEGDYYVYTSVSWEAGTGYKGAMRQQGGWVWQRIKVKNGESQNVILSLDNYVPFHGKVRESYP